MSQDFIYLLAISCGAIIWVKALPFVYYMKLFIKHFRNIPDTKPLPRIKPIDCESCLSFWVAFAYMASTSTIPQALAIGLIVYMFTALLTKLI